MNVSIATASEEQTQVTDDIAERLEMIHEGACKSNARSRSVSGASENLANVTATLMAQVDKFLLK